MWWNTIAAVMLGAFGVGSALHALLNKRDPRSSIGWIGLCLIVPLFGAIGYWVLGQNRIKTKAQAWQRRGRFAIDDRAYGSAEAELSTVHPKRAETMGALLQMAGRVTRKPLLRGNSVEPLFNGEQAYPAMLDAIEGAKKCVYLCTYIFDSDAAGRRFIDALGAAAARGVAVKVLIDDFGERYSRPRAGKLLRRREGVQVAEFLPFTPTLRGLRINLRNHRKLLVVDNEVGFTGGMNIGQRHMVEDPDNKHKTADVHFRIRGPAVHAMEEMFFEDWYFTTGEEPKWQEEDFSTEPVGPAMCRAIPDGPNEDFEVLQWILVGAISAARERVQIMTPYFLPTRELLAALNAAALRGLQVDVVLPSKNNLPFVAWAAQGLLPEVLQYGVRVYYQPPPFDHTKLLVVDEFYLVLGSGNLDPRSLRLNFEFNLEVYEPELAHRMSKYMDRIRERSRQVTIEELERRSFGIKLRDSLAKLASPYL